MRTEHSYRANLKPEDHPKPVMDLEKRKQYRFKGRSNKVGDINDSTPHWVDYK